MKEKAKTGTLKAKKAYWAKALALSLSLAGIAVSYRFGRMSIEPAKPVFLVDKVRTRIIDSNKVSGTPLEIRDKDGNTILGDVTSVRFYFWNAGRKPIKPDSILEPLIVSLDDPNSQILDHKILKVSRNLSKPLLTPHPSDPNRTLGISFAIFEKNDGFTGQIIYKGNPNSAVQVSGTVEDAGDISTDSEVRGSSFRQRYGMLLVTLLMVSIFMGGYFWLSRREDKINAFFYKHTRSKRVAFWGGLVVLMVPIVVLLILSQIVFNNTSAATEFISGVPERLIPEQILP
jgi:hypothetical protein